MNFKNAFALKLNLYFENGTFVFAGQQIDSIVPIRFIENLRVLIPSTLSFVKL